MSTLTSTLEEQKTPLVEPRLEEQRLLLIEPRRAQPVATAVRPLRILYVEQNIDGTTGGSYRSLLFLVGGLDGRHYTRIVAFHREHELIDQFKAAGCRTMMLPYPTTFAFARRLALRGGIGAAVAPLARLAQKALNAVGVSAPKVLRYARLLRKERIDILHLNNGVQVGPEWVVAAKLVGVKCLHHQRGIDPVSKWNIWLARRVDHVICVSEAARAHLIAHGLPPERCTAIHNGINQEALRRQVQRSPAEVRAALGIAPDTLIVGLAGMIRRWKGQLVLVRAMERLRKAHPDLRAIIMGGTSDRDTDDQAYLAEIRALIRTSSLQDQILMLDYQANAPEFLQIFDIMVHTAIEPEPFSRVVIEGMALERPIVASENGGTPEAIEDGVSGLLVPPGDADALAEKIDLLIRRPDLRAALGRGAKLKVERQFLISVHVERTRAVYEQVLKGLPA